MEKNLYTPGRPRALDNEALAQVEKEAMNAYLHNNTTPAGKFGIDGQSTIHDMILEGAKETSERRGQVFNRIGIDPKTEKRVIDLANLKSAPTEETTGYRARATTSIYMATSTVILFYCVSILLKCPTDKHDRRLPTPYPVGDDQGASVLNTLHNQNLLKYF